MISDAAPLEFLGYLVARTERSPEPEGEHEAAGQLDHTIEDVLAILQRLERLKTLLAGMARFRLGDRHQAEDMHMAA